MSNRRDAVSSGIEDDEKFALARIRKKAKGKKAQ